MLRISDSPKLLLEPRIEGRFLPQSTELFRYQEAKTQKFQADESDPGTGRQRRHESKDTHDDENNADGDAEDTKHEHERVVSDEWLEVSGVAVLATTH